MTHFKKQKIRVILLFRLEIITNLTIFVIKIKNFNIENILCMSQTPHKWTNRDPQFQKRRCPAIELVHARPLYVLRLRRVT